MAANLLLVYLTYFLKSVYHLLVDVAIRTWATFSRRPCNTSLFFPNKPASFDVRTSPKNDTAASSASQTMNVHSFVRSFCPSLYKGFLSSWWLPNAHFQSVYCILGNFSRVDPMPYTRTLLRLPDGGTIGLDFVAHTAESESTSDDDPERPIIMVLPGSTGGSDESYVRAVLSQTCKPKSDGGLGYRGVVVNFRGCAGVPLTSPQLYSPGHTDDFRTAVMYVSDLYPKAAILGIGFSLGGGVLTRYMSEEGDQCRLRAGCVLGCTWDQVKNFKIFESSFIGRGIYSRAMGTYAVNLYARQFSTTGMFPDSIAALHADKLLSLRYPKATDGIEYLVRLIGGSSPPFPFPSTHAYFTWASTHRDLKNVRRPLLAIHARDDPFVSCSPIKEVEEESQWVVLALTEKGGHLGWFEGGNPIPWRGGYPTRWFSNAVAEWCKAMVENLESDAGEHIYTEKLMDGEFRVQRGKPFVGYRILKDKGTPVVRTEGEGCSTLEGI